VETLSLLFVPPTEGGGMGINMRILEQENIRAYKSMRTDYIFDKLNDLDDVIDIITLFQSTGVDIKNILVSELGDWEDGPLILGYSNEAELRQSIEDFNEKRIEKYLINGEYGDTLLSASIYPEISKMSVRYQPRIKAELKKMFDELISSDSDSMNNVN